MSTSMGWIRGALGLWVAILVAREAASQPRLLFTDIESGPNVGGEGNLGAFISIHGEGFGATQGASTVTIGGQPVARVVSWGQDNAARSLDLVVVQPGPGVVSGSIVVTVGGQASNGLPFTVRPGSVYFVDQATGNDGNPGTQAQPWATLWRPRQTMVAGDIVYVMGGTFTQLDPAMPGWDTILFLDTALGVSGTAAAPIAYLGYPGNPPVLTNPAARRGIYLNQDSGPLSYVVIGNLSFSVMRDALLVTGIGHRIVGNDLSNGGEGDKIGVFGDTSAIAILGNRLIDNGTPTTKYYAFYVQGFGVNRDIDIGWNEVRGQEGRSIQVYGHAPGDIVDDLRLHDNVFAGSDLNNVLLGGSDGGTEILGTVSVTGNVIAGARGAEGLRVNDPQGTVVIENNTFVGNAVAQVYLEEAGAGRITLRDNVVVAGAGQQYYEFDVASSPASFAPANNLVFGAGPCDPWDTGCTSQDPLFAGPSDYHLQSTSPAIDAGVTTTVVRDHEGVPRPQGAAFDIGAYEYASGGSTTRPTFLAGEGLGPPNPNRVRVFDENGAVAKVNFYAYGTLRYGVNVAGGGVDGDAYDEIVTGPGPGAVFGPHVRGFNVDGGSAAPIAKISFFAYGTLKFGVNVSGGDVESDGFDEILTAPGPGVVFGPQVRGFDYDGAAIASISKINFNAFATTQYGANVAGGDADGDAFAEIAGAPGPGASPSFPSRFLGFDYDGAAIAALPGFDVTPFTTSYGGRVGLGSIPADGRDDLVAGAGRDPAADATVAAHRYTGASLTPYAPFVAFPAATYGVSATAGDL